MFRVDREEKERFYIDRKIYIKTKNELILKYKTKAFCIGELEDGKLYSYIISSEGIESLWSINERERKIYDKEMYGA